MSSCFVFGVVVYVFPCQSTGGDPVLFFFCLAVYDGSFEAGSVFDLDGFTCNHQTNSYRFIQSNYRYIIAAIISNTILLPQRHFCENLYFSNSSFE